MKNLEFIHSKRPEAIEEYKRQCVSFSEDVLIEISKFSQDYDVTVEHIVDKLENYPYLKIFFDGLIGTFS